MVDCDSPALLQAYNDVRDDKTDTDWCVATFVPFFSFFFFSFLNTSSFLPFSFLDRNVFLCGKKHSIH